MPVLILYLCKVSVSLAAAWLFYQLLLRRLTFYSWNRWYLLGYTLLSFYVPFIDVKEVVVQPGSIEAPVLRYIPLFRPLPPQHHWTWLFALLALGALIQLIRLGGSWLSLQKMRAGALIHKQGDIKIYEVQKPIIPFSFAGAIYINPGRHTKAEWEEIILHEYVHIRQRHSLDIIVGEILCILNWYNPFAWLIRYAIRQNLEFIADREILKDGCDRKEYQYHLLKVIGETRFRLANNFNESSLKKRIIMMNKVKSAKLHLFRFLFLIPLLEVLLLTLQGRGQNSRNEATAAVETIRIPQRTVRSLDTTGRPTFYDEFPLYKDATGAPMWVIDSVEVYKDMVGHIPPNTTLYSYNWKREDGIKKFGQKARNGVLSVKWKPLDSAGHSYADIHGLFHTLNPRSADRMTLVNGRTDYDSATFFKVMKKEELAEVEVSSDPADLEKYGLLPNGEIINMIDKAHLHDPNAHFFSTQVKNP